MVNRTYFEKFTPNTIDTLEGFLKEIKTVKKNQISFENQESVTGMAGIGAPLMNHTGQVIAAFAVTGNAENIRKQKEKIVEAVRYTSRELSSLLGYRQYRMAWTLRAHMKYRKKILIHFRGTHEDFI